MEKWINQNTKIQIDILSLFHQRLLQIVGYFVALRGNRFRRKKKGGGEERAERDEKKKKRGGGI